jgi:hypothetical protein
MCKTLLFTVFAVLLTFGYTAAAQDLDGEYESDLLTFNYPEDWEVCDNCFEDEFSIILGTSEDAIEAELDDDPLDEGDAIMYVISDIEAYLDTYDALEDDFSEITAEEIEENYFMPDGYDYGRMRSNDDETMVWLEWEQIDDPQQEGLDIIMQIGEKFVFVGIEAAAGTLNDFEDIAFGVAESVELSDDERRTSGDDLNVYADDILTFEYPEEWVDCGCPPEDLVVIISNNPDVIDDMNELEDGDIEVIVVKDAEEFLEGLDTGVRWDDDLSMAEALEEYFTFEGRDVEVGDVEELEINDREAAARLIINEDTDFEQLQILIQLERRRVVLVLAITRVGFMEDYEDAVFALVESIEPAD